MKVWNNGDFIEMNIGQQVTVFRCGSGHTTFGERATLNKVTAQHLIFVTDSGAVVKTQKDNLHGVVGKAQKNGYCVTTRAYEDFSNMIHEAVKYWSEKTLTFEYK